jgi:hypothetical protein
MAFTQRNMAAGNPPKKGTIISTMETIPGFKKVNTPVKKTDDKMTKTFTPVKKTAIKTTGSNPVVKDLPEVTVTAKRTSKVTTLPEIKITASRKKATPYVYVIGDNKLGSVPREVNQAEFAAWKGSKARMGVDKSGKGIIPAGATFKTYKAKG